VVGVATGLIVEVVVATAGGTEDHKGANEGADGSGPPVEQGLTEDESAVRDASGVGDETL